MLTKAFFINFFAKNTNRPFERAEQHMELWENLCFKHVKKAHFEHIPKSEKLRRRSGNGRRALDLC